MRDRGLAALAVVVAAAVSLTACVAPAPTGSAFAAKASSTAAAAASEVATVRLTTQLLLDGRLPQNYADVTISASEDALSSIAQGFSIVQPPDPGSDQLRAELGDLLDDAADAVAAARIAGRRDDRAGLSTALLQLDSAAAALQSAEEKLG